MDLFRKNEDVQDAQFYTVAGKPLICHHCANDTFYVKSPIIFFRGDFINRKTTCFVCAACTHMHWFNSSE